MKIVIATATFLLGTTFSPAMTFTDNFNTGPSSLWDNGLGNWFGSGGIYDCASPNNNPTTYTQLPFDVADFILDADVNNFLDGGIYLRADRNQNGVLLVTGGFTRTYDGFYWHEIIHGGFTGPYNLVGNLGIRATTVHVKVVASGNTFTVYHNGSSTPTTTFTTTNFYHGKVGLYDFSAQTFDNFSLVASDPVNIQGDVVLNDFVASPAGTAVQVSFFDNGHFMNSVQTTLDATGHYSAQLVIPAGSWTAKVKASHWLTQSAGTVTVTGTATVNIPTANLTNGDVDQDDEIGPGDFGGLSSAYGSSDGDPNWNHDADLDGDGEVGPSDFGILSSNYGLTGD